MLLESTNMTDKELDEAITNHLKKLDDLNVQDNIDRKAKLNTCELNDLYYVNYTGDWNGNSQLSMDEHLNVTTENSEWKCKTPYSISTPTHSIKSNICSGDLTQNRNFHLNDESDDEKFNLLHKLRQRLANYQEKQGIPRADYTFSSLIKIMGQITGKSLLALIYIIVNIAPMAHIILFIMRFIVDKILNIQKTKDGQQIVLKLMLLACQLTCVYICLTFIIGLIWMPILNMTLRIISSCTIDATS